MITLTLDRGRRTGWNCSTSKSRPICAVDRRIELTSRARRQRRRRASAIVLAARIARRSACRAPLPRSRSAEPVVERGRSRRCSRTSADRGLPALFDSGSASASCCCWRRSCSGRPTPSRRGTARRWSRRTSSANAARSARGHPRLVATTVAHTGSVIAVAVILWRVYGNDVPAAAQGWLQFAGGLLDRRRRAVAVPAAASRGQADHFHLFAGHHHHHGPRPRHHHDHDDHTTITTAAAGSAKTTGSAGCGWCCMGLGGGIIPCWDAVLLLLVARRPRPARVRDAAAVRVQPRAGRRAGGARGRGGVRQPGRRPAVRRAPVVPAPADGQRRTVAGRSGVWFVRDGMQTRCVAAE